VTERTATFFDRYAVDFNAIYGNSDRAFDGVINRLFRRAMLLRFERTLAGCNPIEGTSVIDVGCGPGHYSVALARAGAARVLGLDFAPGMLTIASQAAQTAGVAQRCAFASGDFLTYPIEEKFDYAVVMGFMDYIRDARAVIDRVCAITRRRAFFSFPKAGGPLAWQRQLRYRSRCDLFLYREEQIRKLMASTGAAFSIDSIARDFFVTLQPKRPA
jgi:2-polyprenyl-3-methyl-5-hydroxy-6-metoxy-1,4-benzoquinol methylase